MATIFLILGRGGVSPTYTLTSHLEIGHFRGVRDVGSLDGFSRALAN
jgi:hypothetical protein